MTPRKRAVKRIIAIDCLLVDLCDLFRKDKAYVWTTFE